MLLFFFLSRGVSEHGARWMAFSPAAVVASPDEKVRVSEAGREPVREPQGGRVQPADRKLKATPPFIEILVTVTSPADIKGDRWTFLLLCCLPLKVPYS